MDYRKIIEFSNGSFVVTMPKAWVQKHKLRKGDSVGLEENSDQLVFYPNTKEIRKKTTSITINAEERKIDEIKAEIVTAYLNNYNTIEIISKNLVDKAPVIKGILRNLSGMEIMEQTATRIVARDLIDVSSISIKNLIRRMDVITRSMIDDLQASMQNDYDTESIVQRDVDINRLFYLGCRVIKNAMEDPFVQKNLKVKSWTVLSYFMMLQRIEEIADRHKRMARLLMEHPLQGKSLGEFQELHSTFAKRYQAAMKAFYNADQKLAYEIEINNKKNIDSCNDFLEKITKRFSKQNVNSNQMLSAINMVDYTKSCFSFIKYIARIVLNVDQ